MGRQYSADEIILMAFYAEWIRDIPDMRSVQPDNLDRDRDVFLWGLIKLSVMGWVQGVSWQPATANMPKKVQSLSMENIMLTREGVLHAQEIAEVGKECRNKIMANLVEIFRDIGSGTFANIISNRLGL